MEQSNFGYWGRILRVNLGRRAWSVEQPESDVYRRYVGGRSLALYYLLRETSAGMDPLGRKTSLYS